MLLGATLVGAPQLLGGRLPWAVGPIGAGAWLTLAATLWAVPARQRRLSGLHWGVPLLWAWTWLAALPWPCAWIHWLRPEIATQQILALGVLGEVPQRCTMSADPGATQLEVVKWTGILAVFLAAAVLTRAGQRRAVLQCVGYAGGAMTIVALGHLAAGLQQVFGLYTPQHMGSQLFYAPLLNMNHLGGFLLLGVAVQYGQGRAAVLPERRWAWFGLAGLGIATLVLTLSRGALSGLALLAALLLGLHLRSRAERGRSLRVGPLLWLGAALLGCIALGAQVVAAPLLDEILSRDFSKLRLLRQGVTTLGLAPLAGLGRGAFAAVFARLYPVPQRVNFIESLPLQWATEWGLPVALALSVAIVVRLVQAFRTPVAREGRRDGRLEAAAGLSAYGFQNLLDYGLELMGCAVVAAAVLGALGSGRVSNHSRTRQRRSNAGERPVGRSRAARGWLAQLPRFDPRFWLASALVPLLWYGPRLVTESVDGVVRSLQVADLAPADGYERLRRGLLLHPQEPAIPYQGAAWALAHGLPEIGPLIQRSQDLAPGWAGNYLLEARWRWRENRPVDVARALRKAAELEPPLALPWACEALGKRPELVPLVVGKSPARWFGEHLAHCLPSDSPALRPLDLRLMGQFPQDLDEPFLREARRLRGAGAEVSAESVMRKAIALAPKRPRRWNELLVMLLQTHRIEDARQVRAAAAQQIGTEDPVLLRADVMIQGRLGDSEKMRAAFAKLRDHVAGDPQRVADAYWLLGDSERSMGNLRQALHAMADAYSIAQHGQAAVTAAHLAGSLGYRDQAALWWSRACKVLPEHPQACEVAARRTGPGVNR